MGFWFKSRYRYILLFSLSLPVLLISLKIRAGKHAFILIIVSTSIYLFYHASLILPIKLQSLQFSSYIFSSWALHYIFMYLIIIVLAQLILKWVK